ncbi:hypothetical protein RYH80_05660 [Halobaculum sp. MBLA0147]
MSTSTGTTQSSGGEGLGEIGTQTMAIGGLALLAVVVAVAS